MKCFHCKQEIVWSKNEQGKCQEARYKIIALDRPYLNIFFHISCFSEIKDDLLVYLTEHMEDVIQLISANKVRRGNAKI